MPKTWILDLDGTLVVHDGPFIMGKDDISGARHKVSSPLPGKIGAWMDF